MPGPGLRHCSQRAVGVRGFCVDKELGKPGARAQLLVQEKIQRPRMVAQGRPEAPQLEGTQERPCRRG